jgi:hypothetical protein
VMSSAASSVESPPNSSGGADGLSSWMPPHHDVSMAIFHSASTTHVRYRRPEHSVKWPLDHTRGATWQICQPSTVFRWI